MSHMKGKDWLKVAALGGLGATGLGLAGVGPMAGLLGGEAAAAGAGAGAAAAGSSLPGASGLAELAGATGAGLAETPSVVLHPLDAFMGGLKDMGAKAVGGYSNLNKVETGLERFGKASNAIKAAGLLNAEPAPQGGHVPAAWGQGMPPQATILYPQSQPGQGTQPAAGLQGLLSGLDPYDPRNAQLLAMLQRGGMA